MPRQARRLAAIRQQEEREEVQTAASSVRASEFASVMAGDRARGRMQVRQAHPVGGANGSSAMSGTQGNGQMRLSRTGERADASAFLFLRTPERRTTRRCLRVMNEYMYEYVMLSCETLPAERLIHLDDGRRCNNAAKHNTNRC